MTDRAEKVAHVKKARQDRSHTCHWPGCTQKCPPAKWGCLNHWRMLPKRLRDMIWDTYEIGQESSLRPSREYVLAAHEVRDWIEEHYPSGT